MTSLSKHRQTILYGLSLALLLFLMRWLELRFIIIDHALEIYIAIIAVIFTCLGIWLALKLAKPKIKTIVVEKEIYISSSPDFKMNQNEADRLNISRRELEVLELMAKGMTNDEIAEQLYLSLNTIKTHSSRLFEKLEVKRRTQAVEKAKRLHLIP